MLQLLRSASSSDKETSSDNRSLLNQSLINNTLVGKRPLYSLCC